MLQACKRFELHTFSSFKEIRTNSLLPRMTDQQLRHFQLEKSENNNFRLLRRFPIVNLDCNNSRTAWPISAIRYRCLANLKLFYMRVTIKQLVLILYGLFTIFLGKVVCFKHATQIPAREVLLVKVKNMHMFLCFLETRKRFSQEEVFISNFCKRNCKSSFFVLLHNDLIVGNYWARKNASWFHGLIVNNQKQSAYKIKAF